MTSEQGFISQLLAVPKKDGGIRPVVNLKVLNSHVQPVQDGRHSPTEEPATPRGLDDKGRSERCLFCESSQPPRQEFPEISLASQDVPVQLSTVRSVVGPIDLYQGHKAGSDYSQNSGHENYHLHRRHSGDGSKQGTGSGAHRGHSCWRTWGLQSIGRSLCPTPHRKSTSWVSLQILF